MTKFHNVEKVTKNNLTIISKPHAHPHTMKKTHAKFQNDRYKTVRGVALTRSTHCLYTGGWKMTKFTIWKKWQKNVLTIIPKPHAHPHTMKKTHAKFQNNQYKTVRGVALTRDTHGLYIEVKQEFRGRRHRTCWRKSHRSLNQNVVIK